MPRGRAGEACRRLARARSGARWRGARRDLMIAGSLDPARDPRREGGLELAALPRREPPRVEPERALQLVQARELLGLVAVDRDVQGAAAQVARSVAAGSLELGDEAGIEPGGGQVQLEQRLLAEVGLGHGGEHPGGDPGRSARRLAGLEHERAHAVLGRAPGDREADHAGSDHNELADPVRLPSHWLLWRGIFLKSGHRHRFGRHGAAVTSTFPAPALPGSGSTVGGASRPLSPVRRAPVAWSILVARGRSVVRPAPRYPRRNSRSAFWAWRRFSAWSQTAERSP